MQNDANVQNTVKAANAASENANATAQNAVETATPNALVEGTVKKFTLKVMRVQLFEDADIVNVQLTFDKVIPGFVKSDDGDYVPSDVDHISLSRSALTRALCEKDEMIATMRDGQSSPLSRAQLSTVLHGAVLTVTRTYHDVGFVPEDRDALERAQWFTTIDNVSLSKFAQNLIQQLVMQRLLQD